MHPSLTFKRARTQSHDSASQRAPPPCSIPTMIAMPAARYWLDRHQRVLSRTSSLERGWNGFRASLMNVAGRGGW